MKGLYLIVNIGLLVLLTDATLFSGNTVSQDDQCPSWTRPVNTTDDNIICECGDNLGGIISFDNETKEVFVANCVCVTYDKDQQQIILAGCPYFCYYSTTDVYRLPNNVSDLSNVVCGQEWNREGQLCGDCKKGFAPPVLSYEFGCMECNSNDSVTGWIKFVAFGILPSTIFFIVVITLRLSVTSPKLIGFIFFAQLFSSAPIIYHGKAVMNSYGNNLLSASMKVLLDIVWAFNGLFNLDFFYTLLPPFCIPGINTLAKLALQLFIAVYPLLLVLFVYILVELHARDVKIIVYLWKPFHKCFVRFRREGNIQTTIIDAFATIFLLSYVKITVTCTELIASTKV